MPENIPELREIQKHFKSHLTSGDDDILQQIVSTEELSNKDRLAIYGNAYYSRLAEVLEDDYEAIHTLLGDDEFSSLCKRYIDLYPSKFFTLRWFGQYMADFLKSNAPYSTHEYLYEMAIFEWRFTDAFDAKDATTIGESDIALVPVERWPELTFRLHPSVSWFTYHWNILPVWKAATEDGDVPVLQKLDEPETCVVWRHDLATKYRTPDSNEAILIKAAAEGKNFSQLCELLVGKGESAEEVPMITAGFLKTWLNLGMITGINY